MIKKYLFAWGAIIIPSFVALAEPSPTQQLSDQQLIQKRKSDKVHQYLHCLTSIYYLLLMKREIFISHRFFLFEY
ncbi:hypothetical protein H3S74_00030 [Gilliamella sp. W8126]|uniref:Uncharacterized protein n=1 Tax=Gilliamella apis TaxID=1970738 RepID=A0A2V4DMG9_9GAMM|nr:MULTISPECIES: hypothetical protein [Gilliamella]MBI0004622.1 hypothetical protein [Gilliamella sp. W8126]PXY90588.1 hypothetical protein DKK78_09375 [Gilliamella apis]WLS94827.1 hypothetical protein RAM17_04255 [Gilliamella apis]